MAKVTGKCSTKYSIHHVMVFILTFFSYASLHATRKTLSNVKSSISAEWTPTFYNSSVPKLKPDYLWNKRTLFRSTKDADPFLGYLDTSFMLAYAAGLYFSGFLGDRLDKRLVLSFGMFLTAIVVFFFGTFTELVHYYHTYLYLLLMILNGFVQSTGWPTVVAIMGNWFGKSSRGLVLGAWSACASFGNIIGSLVVSSVLHFGYEYAFMMTSTILAGLAIFNYFGLVCSPADIGLETSDNRNSSSQNEADPLITDNTAEDESVGEPGQKVKPKPIKFFQAFLLPGVALCAAAYACLKLVNYSFFFWLPLYLDRTYHWEESVSDQISIWYDIGGIIGGTVGGFISDRIQKRAVVVIPMLALAIPSLFLYAKFPSAYNMAINSLMLGIAGFFIGGVANLISAAISADLGQQGPLKQNKASLATVTGIIDGTGSLGAAVGQILLPYIETGVGWNWVFYMFIIMTACTAFCLMPMFVREMREMWRGKMPRYLRVLQVPTG